MYDVAVCGGTLGIFVATSLALRGVKVVVVERGELKGVSSEIWDLQPGFRTKGLQGMYEVGIGCFGWRVFV